MEPEEILIGKIQGIRVGMGGYQDAMIGVTVQLGSDKEGWGTVDFKGAWAIDRSDYCKWTEEDRIKSLGETMMWLGTLLSAAKKQHSAELVGVPVAVTFAKGSLKSWRILTEAI